MMPCGKAGKNKPNLIVKKVKITAVDMCDVHIAY